MSKTMNYEYVNLLIHLEVMLNECLDVRVHFHPDTGVYVITDNGVRTEYDSPSSFCDALKPYLRQQQSTGKL
jgi:hypothetical protein